MDAIKLRYRCAILQADMNGKSRAICTFGKVSGVVLDHRVIAILDSRLKKL